MRNDFSDDHAWEWIAAEIVSAYQPNFDPTTDNAVEMLNDRFDVLDDHSLYGSTGEQIAATVTRDYPHESGHPAFFVVDSRSIHDNKHPVVVVSKNERDVARVFRCLQNLVYMITSNLDLANLDFDELAQSADPDGVVRR